MLFQVTFNMMQFETGSGYLNICKLDTVYVYRKAILDRKIYAFMLIRNDNVVCGALQYNEIQWKYVRFRIYHSIYFQMC